MWQLRQREADFRLSFIMYLLCVFDYAIKPLGSSIFSDWIKTLLWLFSSQWFSSFVNHQSLKSSDSVVSYNQDHPLPPIYHIDWACWLTCSVFAHPCFPLSPPWTLLYFDRFYFYRQRAYWHVSYTHCHSGANSENMNESRNLIFLTVTQWRNECRKNSNSCNWSASWALALQRRLVPSFMLSSWTLII